MLWLIYAIVAMFAEGIKDVINRFVMLSEDPYAYAFIGNILASVFFFILLLIAGITLPKESFAWIFVLLSSIVWVIIMIVANYSYKYTEVSIRAPISEIKLLILLVLSALVLSEAIVLKKLIGTLLIFGGLFVISYKGKKLFGRLSEKGVKLTLLASLFGAMVILIDKKGMGYFTPETYGFFVYLIPTFILLFFLRNKKKELKSIISKRWIYMVSVAILSSLYYLFKLKALVLVDASIAFPVIRISSLITVLGGVIFLRERKEILKKIIATVLIMIGAILIVGAA